MITVMNFTGLFLFRNIPCIKKDTIAKCSNLSFVALRPKKTKSNRKESDYFVDAKRIRTIGGKGGDGCISFLQLWSNERAGPDGGDGGNGGHVIFEATTNIRNLNHLNSIIKGENGENGHSKDCHGKNAKHTVINVPLGTIVRNEFGHIVGDLDQQCDMFVAARGGIGGKGNRFFASATEHSPKICEYGPQGEDATYQVELRCLADIGLIGFPNAGKSTLLNAVSRARSKIAPHAFTTLRPHIGIVPYDDHVQLAIADLPGLIQGSHQNKGLGVQFLKHIERCTLLLFVIDISTDQPLEQYKLLMHELQNFNANLVTRPNVIVANKIDQPNVLENLKELQSGAGVPVIPISAKMGNNLAILLSTIREYYETHKRLGGNQYRN